MGVEISNLHIPHLAILKTFESCFVSELVTKFVHNCLKKEVEGGKLWDDEGKSRKLVVISHALGGCVLL